MQKMKASPVKPVREKIFSLKDLLPELESHRSQGRKIVFTNGCFDIIHSGHILYMEDARACGDLLVVGLNSDDSVKRLKGPERPLNPQQDRAIQLAGLASVDYVTFFGEDTPKLLIEAVQPDVLVKGGDWPVEKIVGHEFVFARGGQVHSLPFRQGYSTTGLIEKIRTLRMDDK
ncbi:MAG: D-glycero-beta-D-manno-heptose 1-phosphate adenylyltransferase [Gemmatimonadota bacterium]|nr:D-glycero-beta-D-manno-heptose 1-phosphate adenylyltransferase [Gemmatimonadota bacterium]